MALVTGTPDNDTLIGTADADTINGLAGADTISGGAGNDTIDGGDQMDVINGGDGDDTLESGFNTSNVQTHFGITSFGDGGGNHVHGDAGNDTISGGAGDWLDGGDGADTIKAEYDVAFTSLGPTAVVLITGGDGDDVIWTSGYGVNIGAGAGSDVVKIAGQGHWPAPAVVSLGAGADTLSLQTGGAVSTLFSHPDVTVSDFVATGVEHDTILYTGGQDPFASLLNEGAGKRMGQMGADTILVGGGSGVVTLTGVTATDLTADNFGGHAFALWTFGTVNADSLTGGAGVDHLDGYVGDDVLVGGAAGDQLAGGDGADTFTYLQASDSVSGGQDVLVDFVSGTDRIDLSGVGATSLSLVSLGGATFIFAATGAGDMVIGVEGGVTGSDLLVGDVGVYALGDGAANHLTGGANADILDGGAGADVLTGRAGGDGLLGGAGADVFRFEGAVDSNTDGGVDTLLDFETGVDSIVVAGADAGSATSISLIRSGEATFVFAQLNDGLLQINSVKAINGSDVTSTAGQTSVFMLGDGGDNVLIGGAGKDNIQGGDGADRITGGDGADDLFGGAGADTFLYTPGRYFPGAHSSLNAADTIWDFQSGVDHLDLTGVRTGASDIHGVAYSGGSAFVFVDLGGDGQNDMLIQMHQVTSLAAGDVLF